MRSGEDSNIELRFLISTKVASIIIGKGGENIKKIREEYSVKINIPDSNGPERVLILDGDLGSIIDILYKNLSRMHGNREFGVDLRLLVHQSQAGCVIGRSGYKIKELREQSDLFTLKVYQMLCPCSTDRVIQLVGFVKEVLNCLQAIVELLEGVPPKGSRQNYDARNVDESLLLIYGGWGPSHRPTVARGRSIMPNYSHSQNNVLPGGFFSGTSGSARNGNHSVSQAIANNVPHASAVAMMAAMGGQPTDGNNETNDSANSSMVSAGLMRGMQNPYDLSKMTPTSITHVSVSNKMMGAIMGRSGCRINQVRQESNATINISRQEPGVEDRIITITGTPDQIQNAQFLLQMCVKRYCIHSA